MFPGERGSPVSVKQPRDPRASVERAGGGVGALRGGKLRAADTRRCSTTAKGTVCLGEAAARCVPNRERAGSVG